MNHLSTLSMDAFASGKAQSAYLFNCPYQLLLKLTEAQETYNHITGSVHASHLLHFAPHSAPHVGPTCDHATGNYLDLA